MRKILSIFKLNYQCFYSVTNIALFVIATLMLMNGIQILDDKTLALIEEYMHNAPFYKVMFAFLKILLALIVFSYLTYIVLCLLSQTISDITAKISPKTAEKMNKPLFEHMNFAHRFIGHFFMWFAVLWMLTCIASKHPEMYHITEEWCHKSNDLVLYGFFVPEILSRLFRKVRLAIIKKPLAN